jgi:excisionase family DNA binding protein
LIDSKQAAKLLKVSERTLWRMHHDGEMPPPIRIGRAVRWSLETLRKWVEEGVPHGVNEGRPLSDQPDVRFGSS